LTHYTRVMSRASNTIFHEQNSILANIELCRVRPLDIVRGWPLVPPRCRPRLPAGHSRSGPHAAEWRLALPAMLFTVRRLRSDRVTRACTSSRARRASPTPVTLPAKCLCECARLDALRFSNSDTSPFVISVNAYAAQYGNTSWRNSKDDSLADRCLAAR
jgi:hypothetical protein